jgi:broad specificity phosphatase PhoE
MISLTEDTMGGGIDVRNALFVLVALIMSVGGTAFGQTTFKPTTVIFVRHAEKQDVQGSDPALTAEGEARAKNLARMLASAGIKAVFSSQYIRTKETARPIAEAAGSTTTVIPVTPDPADRRKLAAPSIQGVVDGVYQHEGQTVLVVGHTNSIGPMISALGGESIAEIPESDYGNLFVVTVYAKGKAHVTRLRY